MASLRMVKVEAVPKAPFQSQLMVWDGNPRNPEPTLTRAGPQRLMVAVHLPWSDPVTAAGFCWHLSEIPLKISVLWDPSCPPKPGLQWVWGALGTCEGAR